MQKFVVKIFLNFSLKIFLFIVQQYVLLNLNIKII